MPAMTRIASRPSRTMMPNAARKVSSRGSLCFSGSASASAAIASAAAAASAAFASSSLVSSALAIFKMSFFALSVLVRYLFF